MSDTTQQAQELFGTLDEYLLELADGLAKAQAELGALSSAGAPGRQFTYYVPKLDFELRMDLRVETSTTSGTTGIKVLKMRPVRLAETATTQSTTELVSVIRGSFVAVPANDGLPPVVLDASVSKDATGLPLVTVRVRNAAGEVLPNVEVEFNLDRKATAQVAGIEPSPKTDVTLAVVKTDASGVARTTVRIADDEKARVLALTVDALGRTAALTCEVLR